MRITWLVIGAFAPSAIGAQVCQMPDDVRALVPTAAPEEVPYESLGRGMTPFDEIALGVGHLHHPLDEQAADLPPGGDRWLLRVELPLSRAPVTAPWGWIVGGWIVSSDGARSLTSVGLLETGYEELSFVVLEQSGDWLRIRYAEGEAGVSWVPACALASSPARLAFAAWSDWFLSGEISPLYSRMTTPLEVRSDPSVQSGRLSVVARDDTLEPLEVRGEWMRVTLVHPSDFCREPGTGSRVEGWIQWSSEPLGPTVWYFTRGC